MSAAPRVAILRRCEMRSALPVAGRAVAATAAAWACVTVLGRSWRSAEAGTVVLALHVLGVRSAGHLGDQILVTGRAGATFLTNIEPWCSSLVVVVAFAVLAATVSTAPRRRLRAFSVGAGIVVACNLARMLATVLVGVWAGPKQIEPFHDGIATGFAVLFVLFAFAVFVSILWPRPPSVRPPRTAPRRHEQHAGTRPGLTRRRAIGTGLAAFVVVGAVPQLAFAEDERPTYALDPTRRGKCTSGCSSCRACKTHAANKLFSTKEDGDARRAHPGCRCSIVVGQSLSPAVWEKVFQSGPVADRRNPATQTLLSAGVERHAVPLISGRLPLVGLIGGAGAVLAITAARRREPAGDQER